MVKNLNANLHIFFVASGNICSKCGKDLGFPTREWAVLNLLYVTVQCSRSMEKYSM